jgi:hypothetical protein
MSDSSPSPIFDPLLPLLDRTIRTKRAKAYVTRALESLTHALAEAETSVLMPLECRAFPGLPVQIRTVRLFGLKAGTKAPRERHPNSFQRVVSLEGTGVIQVWGLGGGGSRTSDRGQRHRTDETRPVVSVLHRLRSAEDAPLGKRWSTVPTGLWHQAWASPDSDWVALAFHTAQSRHLVDQYEEPA